MCQDGFERPSVRHCGSARKSQERPCVDAPDAARRPGPLLRSVDLRGPRFELVGPVHLYLGTPGPECGHLRSEQSYFDRFWEYRQGEDTERFYMLLRRNWREGVMWRPLFPLLSL